MNDAVREERLRRWRLVLGRPGGSSSVSTGAAGPGGSTGAAGPAEDAGLSARDAGMDRALAAVYDAAPSVGQRRDAGLGTSAPAVTRWLGDIRTYFPAPLVRVLQQDALERLGLRRMLAEPELLEAIEPDIHLVGTLLSLRGALPPAAPGRRRLASHDPRQLEALPTGPAHDHRRDADRPRPAAQDRRAQGRHS